MTEDQLSTIALIVSPFSGTANDHRFYDVILQLGTNSNLRCRVVGKEVTIEQYEPKR